MKQKCLFLLMILSVAAFAGGRARQGGTLKVAAVATAFEPNPLLADTPVDATVLSLSAPPMCRVAEPSRLPNGVLHLNAPVGVAPAELAKSLTRPRADSPYRALLAGVRAVTPSGAGVDVTFDAPSPDLERALCHTAFALKPGPFSGPTLAANPQYAEGRPYVDSVSVQASDARAAERLLSQRRTHVVLGATVAEEPTQLFATYLVLSSQAPPELRRAIDATLERAELTRFFVHAPATALGGVLPPTLGGPTTLPPRGAKPAPMTPPRELVLWFDASNDDHRAVADKLQVKLQPLGFRLAPRPVARAELRRLWAEGSAELSLQTVLLPPAPAPALAVVLDLAGHRERIATVLGPVNALSDQGARDKAARDAALSTQASLDLIPLYVQGVGVATSRDVQHLTRDAQGLPRLDDVFLSPE